MSQTELSLWAAVESVDHVLDVLDAAGTGGEGGEGGFRTQAGRTDRLDGVRRTLCPAAHRGEGRPRVRREPRSLQPLHAGASGVEVGVSGGQQRVLLGRQGKLCLHHQGTEARGQAGGESLVVEELVVEAEVRIERGRRSGQGCLRSGGDFTLTRTWLLLLDERAHVEGSAGPHCTCAVLAALLLLDGINLLCGLTDTICMSICLLCNN